MITRRTFRSPRPARLALPQNRGDGHVTAAIQPPIASTIEPGEHRLGLGAERDGLLIVPPRYRKESPAPLVHHAARRRRVVAARRRRSSPSRPSSTSSCWCRNRATRSWDAIRGRFGPDVDFLEPCRPHAIERCAIDRRRVADWRLLRRRQLRPLDRPRERRPVHVHPRVLARIHRAVQRPRPSADLHLARHHRQILPIDAPAAASSPSCRRPAIPSIPGIRRPAHRASRDRPPGLRVVPRWLRPRHRRRSRLPASYNGPHATPHPCALVLSLVALSSPDAFGRPRPSSSSRTAAARSSRKPR